MTTKAEGLSVVRGSRESREFWERVLIACIESCIVAPDKIDPVAIADSTLISWTERFERVSTKVPYDGGE
jgi:hypothetical protein